MKRRGERVVRGGFDERIVRLGALSRGNRVLALVGYANVVVLLAILVYFEISGNRLTNVVAFDVDAAVPHEVPFISVVFSLAAFMVGWSLILTGASDCSRRVFIPVLGLFVLQMYLLTQGFGEVQWDSGTQAWWMTVGVAAVVAGIYLLTHRLRQWRDLPLAEFCAWLLVMLILLYMLLGLPEGEVAQRVLWLSFFGLIVTAPFWLLLGLEIIDLAVTISRWFVLGPGRRLPDKAFHVVAVSCLAIQVLFASFVCATAWSGIASGPSSGVMERLALLVSNAFPTYLAYACAFDLLLVVPLLAWGALMRVKRRWTLSAATLVGILGLAAPVITFGGSLALWGGKDFAEAGLSATGLIPPFLLFALLLTYDVLNFGARFANSDGRFVPRNGRVLIYFGVASLVLSVALINVKEHSPITGQPNGTMEFYIDLLFAVGVLLFGPPYLAWTVWRRREWLIGEHESRAGIRPAQMQEDPLADERSSNILFALAGGSVCGILVYMVTYLLTWRVPAWDRGTLAPFEEQGMVSGSVSWIAAVLSVALSVGFGIWYFRRSPSWGAIGALASGTLVYAAMGVFIAWLMIVYKDENAQRTQTVNSETFQPALVLTTDLDWTFSETPAAFELSRGDDSFLTVLNVRGIYDTKGQNGATPGTGQIIGWLRDNPNLRVTSPREVTVGGVHGTQLDAVVVSAPVRRSAACSGRCAYLFTLDNGDVSWVWKGNKARISVLRRGTDTMVIVSQSPAEKFDRFASESSEVLSTLAWRHLVPKDYVFDRFDPPLSFHLGEGWNYYEHTPDFASLQGGDGAYLSFVNARRVYGPETPNTSGIQAAPADLVGWFEDHPYLKVENLRTGEVGDVSGPTFDVVVPPLPRHYSSVCGEACVPVFFVSDRVSVGEHVSLEEGSEYRVSIVHVRDETIVAIVQGKPESFDSFLPRAESVLRSVDWDSAGIRGV